MSAAPQIALVTDPRFPGGTSAAVAQELLLLHRFAPVRFAGLDTSMFRGETPAPTLQAALAECGLSLDWAPPVVTAETVVVHNPACLKFDGALKTRLVARRLVVVTHENFLRPDGSEGFDVASCLNAIDRASFAVERWIAPVSSWNRRTIETWAARNRLPRGWAILGHDWHNICDFPLGGANPSPRDRRGRLSRPGPEKFPPLAVLDANFPRHAEANVILGGDLFATEARSRPHWTIWNFGSRTAADLFDEIDFLVFFTAEQSRESFGRALAEGIAAGKVVISDPETASTFRGGVIGARPEEVDSIIARLVADPRAYLRQVSTAQSALSAFSADAFLQAQGPVLLGARQVRSAVA
jgi:hypothetical protein